MILSLKKVLYLVFIKTIMFLRIPSYKLFKPGRYIYTDNTINVPYDCITGRNLTYLTTSETDCCLACQTNRQFNCLAGNYYPADGRCEIFETWSEINFATGCLSFRKFGICPYGFIYSPDYKTCLKLLNLTTVTKYPWKMGLDFCNMIAPMAFMVKVDNLKKATYIINFVSKFGPGCRQLADNIVAWTGGSREDRQSGSGNFYWFGPNNSMTMINNMWLDMVPESCVALLSLPSEGMFFSAVYLAGESCLKENCVLCEAIPNM
ncbi:hypothetical protein HELRODRAFT_178802 [Helobdella robusta]|uniref:C-type lectin domain-containing protein n=1 Tax=Helobdella robusta TaxID=6412 RepID=T1FDR4_HELRO|nr:hypothetical protein HELRODRAFT_178802 [Helobdella robusta]ESN95887.1 hypothetical protein HELRODRAFT_178802 [Helobdella robusta]